jgi:small neutral amino acid transporter SnatA (MarC family)
MKLGLAKSATALVVLTLVAFAALPSVEAHRVSCTGTAIQGGLCLILCGVEHSITAPPHSCSYCPQELSLCVGETEILP